MQYIPPPSDDRIRPFDSPLERLRKQIHQLAQKALRPTGKVEASPEQLLHALNHVVQLLHQASPQLSESEQHQLLKTLLCGIQEKTHKISVRFIENN